MCVEQSVWKMLSELFTHDSSNPIEENSKHCQRSLMFLSCIVFSEVRLQERNYQY